MPVYNTPYTQNLLKRASYSPAYHSPYGPQYTIPVHWHGLTIPKVTKAATIASGFGVAAGIFAVFFFGEVPRVRKDILQKLPFFDKYLDRTVPPEDSPF
ncbi:hypothetical protein TMatcc_001012 [Talaromyces marneffei ATCC 18224]|uniref:Uncharacterized protein n=1 Tax=Talaromyces marneffei (strain ATCC 18224 / CBS 334.59 / QM 7333) TaxID=441960 RepID=B6QRL4_TALMQ|nr:uncharacterized protein EYB26_003537 [Talaromyces marneffei]EEA21007.1 conserved hypothetical protein [Talaromyces marneffei ATCC 18224]KAE8549952.1 hypothetical protein EYB25_008477 [Talaromyces marneffei]QGA15876.1 hypothetical protein EYB26_003537 [Talaromyces marneffei]